MDVGFNNTNTFEQKELKDVVFLVEATSDEQFNLWKEYSNDRKADLETEIHVPEFKKLLKSNFVNFLSSDIMRELKQLEILIRDVELKNDIIKEIKKYKVDWVSNSMGLMVCVGKYNGKEIWICFSFAMINGYKIGFYYPTSNVVNHSIIENFIQERFQLTHDGYTRWNHVDAKNFHNCIGGLKNLDKEPRTTVFKNYNVIE